MAQEQLATNAKEPTTIKKYANRRLYNTGTSAYVTLEDLAQMVKKGEDFVVHDAKTGEDITRSVLTQIIFEQESKVGQSMLPITFLRQLIRFYGDSMQMLVPSYLEFSIDKLTGEQQKFRDQITNAFGGTPLAEPTRQVFQSLEDQTRKNMQMFRQALAMFNPFALGAGTTAPEPNPSGSKNSPSDIEDMRRQLEEMRARLDGLTKKD
ncbi:MAG TPA: polyhydroxyalkanoate synthesis repressor PhaR [Beijerinckiaceae bacterium]|jgi:polyhydroxyalkanoate synthesis repressor PhaR|nr:polyhydroxyalkanoate synthesis repressor PhaR [Beijerinckiaceae bacterium]